jgi:hypothetical protein
MMATTPAQTAKTITNDCSACHQILGRRTSQDPERLGIEIGLTRLCPQTQNPATFHTALLKGLLASPSADPKMNCPIDAKGQRS